MCVCMRVPPVHMWKSENNMQELVLSYHHMEPGDQIQVVMLGGKDLSLPAEPFHQLFKQNFICPPNGYS